VVGDRLYGRRPAAGAPREPLALQAYRLELSHPIDGRRLCFEVPPPPWYGPAPGP